MSHERRKEFRSEVNKVKSEYASFSELEKAQALEQAIAAHNMTEAFGIMMAQGAVNQTDDDLTTYRGKVHSPEALAQDIDERIGGTFGKDAAAELKVMLKDLGEEQGKYRMIHLGETRLRKDEKGKVIATENVSISPETAQEELERETGVRHPLGSDKVQRKYEQMVYDQVKTIAGRANLQTLYGAREGKMSRELHPTAQPHLNFLTGGGRKYTGDPNREEHAFSNMGKFSKTGMVIESAMPDKRLGDVAAARGFQSGARGPEVTGSTRDVNRGGEASLDPRWVYQELKAGGWHQVANYFGQQKFTSEDVVGIERILKKMGLADPKGNTDFHLKDYAAEAFQKTTYKDVDALQGVPLPTAFKEQLVESRTAAEWKNYAENGLVGAVDEHGNLAAPQKLETPVSWIRPGSPDSGYAYQWASGAPAAAPGGGAAPAPGGVRPRAPLVGYDPAVQAKSAAARQQFEFAGYDADQARRAYEAKYAGDIAAGRMYAADEMAKHQAEQQAQAAGAPATRGLGSVAEVERRQVSGYSAEELDKNPHLGSISVRLDFDDERVRERYGVEANQHAGVFDEKTEADKQIKAEVARRLAQDYGQELRGRAAVLDRRIVAGKLGKDIGAVTEEDLKQVTDDDRHQAYEEYDRQFRLYADNREVFDQQLAAKNGKSVGELTPAERDEAYAPYIEGLHQYKTDRHYTEVQVSQEAKKDFENDTSSPEQRVEVRDYKGKLTGDVDVVKGGVTQRLDRGGNVRHYRYTDSAMQSFAAGEALRKMYSEPGIAERQQLFGKTLENT